MKINSLEITNIGGIRHLNLSDLNLQLNIICGENGVGKTNILDALAAYGSEFDKNTLTKTVNSAFGTIKVSSDLDRLNSFIPIRIDNFKPTAYEKYLENQNFNVTKNNLLYLKVNRIFNYKKLSSIESDPDPLHRSRDNISGLENSDIKQWFLNRILHSGHNNHLTQTQINNLELAKKTFSLLNEEYSYSRLDTSNEIYVNTPTGEIIFEYLSSGFKSTLFILLGIIKEIEYRFQENHISAEDFNGVILIDEIELHLHPEWQGKILDILKKSFKKVQFFVSTHSPHVIQSAKMDEVIALQRINGEVEKRQLPNSEYGFQGWTVEEILNDIMGLEDLRSKIYRDLKSKFNKALDEKNLHLAQQAYDELDKMLHPDYALRPVFQIQLETLKGSLNHD